MGEYQLGDPPTDQGPIVGIPKDQLDALHARIRELEAQVAEGDGWQPIETAPMNVEILVWSAEWNVPYLIKAKLKRHGWVAGGFDISNPNQPTHWTPLPNPPATPHGT